MIVTLWSGFFLRRSCRASPEGLGRARFDTPAALPNLVYQKVNLVFDVRVSRIGERCPMRPDTTLTRMRADLVLHLASRLRDDMLRLAEETGTSLPQVAPVELPSHETCEEAPTPASTEATSVVPSSGSSDFVPENAIPEDWLLSAAYEN